MNPHIYGLYNGKATVNLDRIYKESIFYTQPDSFFGGKAKKGQTITIDGINSDDIIEILGEITQDQLANADITVADGHSHLSYEDFIIERKHK